MELSRARELAREMRKEESAAVVDSVLKNVCWPRASTLRSADRSDLLRRVRMIISPTSWRARLKEPEHRRKGRSNPNTYAYPFIGEKPVEQIT